MGEFRVLILMPRVMALCSSLLFVGCAGIYDEITINPDGSGTYRLLVFVNLRQSGENLEMLKAAYRERASRFAAAAGFALKSVDVRREKDLLVIEATADFPNLSVFAHPALAVSANLGEWSFVVPREASYQGGRFVARVLRGSAPPQAAPTRVLFKRHDARFTVHLPGEVTHTNGESMGGSANWNFPIDRLCNEPLEMFAEAHAPFPWASVGLGVAFLLGLAVVVGSLFRRRRAA